MDQWQRWQQQYGTPPAGPVRPQRPLPRRGKHGWGFLLLLLLAVGAVVQVGLTPWDLHIGGGFTPTMAWDGYGVVEASNGGRYLLFTHMGVGPLYYRRAGSPCSKGGGCDNLFGQATLCSRSGLDTFELNGRVSAFLHTDGAATVIDLNGGAPNPIPPGWLVAFHGRWNGPDLELDSPDNSFTELFTPSGAIRRVTSTADAGTAHLTLHPGTYQDFQLACGTLQAAAGHRASR